MTDANAPGAFVRPDLAELAFRLADHTRSILNIARLAATLYPHDRVILDAVGLALTTADELSRATLPVAELAAGQRARPDQEEHER